VLSTLQFSVVKFNKVQVPKLELPGQVRTNLNAISDFKFIVTELNVCCFLFFCFILL
jgi:hypothetical protein